ncbi:MAG: DUF4037 domain-containing protein [bacterium]
MFEKFYSKTPRQIAFDVKKFLNEDFFARYPELKKMISIIIVGSVATANYDEHSDIDLDILFFNKKKYESLLKKIKQFKNELRREGIPIQIHRPIILKEIERDLSGWEKDGMLREYSQAVVVSDPGNRFKKIQSKYRWYPKNIYLEKLNWLFAEMIFEYEERFLVAVKRKDSYFGEVVKMKILKHLMTIVLMSNKKYPAFDKHLYQDLKKIKQTSSKFIKLIDKLLESNDLKKNVKLLRDVIEIVEEDLVKKKIISKKPWQYWIDLRPKYKVEMK